MTLAGTDDQFDASLEPRQRLTHALANESSNALARVELAASELSRFGGTPHMQGMVETIRNAVGEIDAFLGTIRALSNCPREGPVGDNEASHYGPALSGALHRIETTLAARGVTLHVSLWETEPSPRRIPGATLERLIFAFLRLGLSTAERGEGIRLDAIQDEQSIGLEWQGPGIRGSAFDSGLVLSHQLDVEAQWAEWGGHLLIDEAAHRLRLIIPKHMDSFLRDRNE